MKGCFDFIIHAASIASPKYYRQYPIQTIDANVLGIHHLLDFAVEYPPESILFFSSSEVYGDPPPECIPTPETYVGNVSFTGPRACYDESKRLGETLCVNFHQVHKVPVKIARPFNNYGPGLKINDRRVISDFFRDVLADRNIIMYSDGTPTRTFCYIADALTGYLLILLSNAEGEAFNIGDDNPEISIKDFEENFNKDQSPDFYKGLLSAYVNSYTIVNGQFPGSQEAQTLGCLVAYLADQILKNEWYQ